MRETDLGETHWSQLGNPRPWRLSGNRRDANHIRLPAELLPQRSHPTAGDIQNDCTAVPLPRSTATQGQRDTQAPCDSSYSSSQVAHGGPLLLPGSCSSYSFGIPSWTHGVFSGPYTSLLFFIFLHILFCGFFLYTSSSGSKALLHKLLNLQGTLSPIHARHSHIEKHQ